MAQVLSGLELLHGDTWAEELCDLLVCVEQLSDRHSQVLMLGTHEVLFRASVQFRVGPRFCPNPGHGCSLCSSGQEVRTPSADLLFLSLLMVFHPFFFS